MHPSHSGKSARISFETSAGIQSAAVMPRLPGLQRGDENFLEAQRLGRQRLRRPRPQAVHHVGGVAVDDDSSSRPRWRSTRAPPRSNAGGSLGKARVNLLIALARRVGRRASARSRPPSMIVNSSMSPSNSEIRCVETNTVRRAGIAVLVGADHRLDELAPDDRIEAGRGLVEHEQLRLGADRGDQRQLRALPLRQMAGLLAQDRAGTDRASARSVSRFQCARNDAK